MMTKDVKETDFKEELRQAFSVFDVDKSGTISPDELRRVMRSIGENFSDDEISEMMRQADKDGNGSIDCGFSSSLLL